MKIRKALLVDLENILKLSGELFEYEKQFTPYFNKNWTRSDHGRKFFEKRLSEQDSICLIAEEKRKILGYMITHIVNFPFRKPSKIANIANMFIIKEFRSKGLGTKMIEETIKLLKQRAIKRIRVEAISKNTEAIDFYKTFGFEDFEIILESNLL